MSLSKRLFFLFCCLIQLNLTFADFKIVCYYSNWSFYRIKEAQFTPEDIDPSLCTHIIYAFSRIENNTLIKYNDRNFVDNSIETDLYNRVLKLKDSNPDLKILVAVGGWNAGSYPFEQVSNNEKTTRLFAKNVVKILREWGFDGLDIDWEYPVLRKTECTNLIRRLRKEFDREALHSGLDKLILSMALSAGQATIDTAYQVDQLGELVDFANLMSYDFHNSWEPKTALHSQLFGDKNDITWTNTLNGDWAVHYLIQKGFPANKLVLGVPFYGRGYLLADVKRGSIGSPTVGASKPGHFTQEGGVLSYFEICELKNEKKRKISYNRELVGSFMKVKDNWIGFENEKSITTKANYVRENCLAGMSVWTIDYDDFKGTYCNKSKFPLLTTINKNLKDKNCQKSEKNSFKLT